MPVAVGRELAAPSSKLKSPLALVTFFSRVQPTVLICFIRARVIIGLSEKHRSSNRQEAQRSYEDVFYLFSLFTFPLLHYPTLLR